MAVAPPPAPPRPSQVPGIFFSLFLSQIETFAFQSAFRKYPITSNQKEMDIETIVKKMQASHATAFQSGVSIAEKAEYGSDYEELPKKMKAVEDGIIRHMAQIGAYTVLGEEIHLDRYRQLARYCGSYYAMARIGRE